MLFCHLLLDNKLFKILEIVMVNFMCRLDWAMSCPDIWSKIILWVFLWGWFWIRLTFLLVEWECKLPFLMWVASFNQPKAWIEQGVWLSCIRENSFCLTVFELGRWLFLAFILKLKHQLFVGHKIPGLWMGMTPSVLVFSPLDSDWNYTMDSPRSPACRLILQFLGLVSLHNHMSQFLIINKQTNKFILNVYTHISYLSMVLFLWRTLANTEA